MLFGMEETELRQFTDRLAATAIVNQAVIKCMVRGISITPDNVILHIGDFIDPNRPGSSRVVEAIMRAVDEVVIDPEEGHKLDS